MACSNNKENCAPKEKCNNNNGINFVIIMVLYILLAIILGAAIC